MAVFSLLSAFVRSSSVGYKHPRLLITLLCLGGLAVSPDIAQAQDEPCGVIRRNNLAPCVLAASPTVRSERAMGEVVQARRLTAAPWLPSNPVLGLSAGRRSNPAQSPFLNWYATLSQELELGGQRRARIDAADAELRGQERRVEVVRRQVAAEAWAAYFEVLAAREELALSTRLEALTATVTRAARGAAERGVGSEIEADVVEASELRVRQGRVQAEGKLASSLATLASLLGREVAGLTVEGELEPLPGVEQAARAARVEERPEVKALADERRAFSARATLYRRQRMPNLTLSLFVQNDGFNERVLGVGLALPIPLPSPVGRAFLGERAEAEAMARRSVVESERFVRESQRELARALADYEAKVRARDAIPPDRVERAGRSLATIADEVQKGRLAVREAIVAQQTLLDLLLANVAARRAVSLSSVELARAAGVDLTRGGA